MFNLNKELIKHNTLEKKKILIKLNNAVNNNNLNKINNNNTINCRSKNSKIDYSYYNLLYNNNNSKLIDKKSYEYKQNFDINRNLNMIKNMLDKNQTLSLNKINYIINENTQYECKYKKERKNINSYKDIDININLIDNIHFNGNSIGEIKSNYINLESSLINNYYEKFSALNTIKKEVFKYKT